MQCDNCDFIKHTNTVVIRFQTSVMNYDNFIKNNYINVMNQCIQDFQGELKNS